MLRVALRLQGTYYVLTGLWPLLDLWTFELATGPKTDDWLVHMVGLLAAAIGVSLWAGARSARPVGAIVLLATTSAASFAAIDLAYGLNGRISAVYLLDAVAELGLLALLVVGWRRRERGG